MEIKIASMTRTVKEPRAKLEFQLAFQDADSKTMFKFLDHLESLIREEVENNGTNANAGQP